MLKEISVSGKNVHFTYSLHLGLQARADNRATAHYGIFFCDAEKRKL